MGTRALLIVHLAAVLLVAVLPSRAHGQIEIEVDRERRLRVAMDRAQGCPPEEILRALDPNVDSVVVNLLNDKDAPVHYRLYAVDCLGHFSNKRSRQVISSLLGDPTWDRIFRLRAFTAAARSMGVEFLADLMETCEERDAETRAAAVRAMAWIPTTRARSYLVQLQTRERDPLVLQAIGEALQRIPVDPLRPPGSDL
ncbi:MAG: HEAT repeat domain-containing protein [Deltaproteobacteria bacterium]|nr:HEAT repeat domain-containing protein [Deltaproteobacteria bacterium]